MVTDGAYNLFEREVLRNSRDFSPTELRASRRRSRTALALFAAAAMLALIQPAAGMGFIALALLLHLRPDAARNARADGALRRAGRRLPVGAGLAGRVGRGTGNRLRVHASPASNPFMVPTPPVPTATLRAHHAAYGTAPDGRPIRGADGGPLSELA